MITVNADNWQDIRKALMLAWRALLADVDNGVDHMAVQRAARAATQRYPRCAGDRPAEWYAMAINHYLDR